MDYSEEFHAPGYLANEKLLPKTVIDQHKLSLEEWENKVSVFHKQVYLLCTYKTSFPPGLYLVIAISRSLMIFALYRF